MQISPMIGDLDHTKLIHLFAAQGKRWKRLRTTTTPAFSVTNLKRVMPIIDDSIRVTMDLLEEASNSDNTVNLHIFFIEMAFDIISRVSMGQRESQQFRNDRLELAVHCFKKFNSSHEDYLAFMFPWAGRNVLNPLMSALGSVLGSQRRRWSGGGGGEKQRSWLHRLVPSHLPLSKYNIPWILINPSLDILDT